MKSVFTWGTLFLLFVCGCAFGGEGKMSWRSSYFDGNEFRQGSLPQHILVYQRQGFMPVVGVEGESFPETPLPDGTGGAVIYCYVESSGGTVRTHGGSIPMGGAVIELGGDRGKILIRSDEKGYAVAGLPAGGYTASVGGITKSFAISQGATTLLPIRTGKRMVD